ncbi:cAMP phosphodiesterases class-II-domain-containing protein [Thelonectria olida]|uniref:cAMP phosphodiesterases class-II-domain-containing protein n=1 Tax=Thelonectria olida TaxID=1576542 RepID=A0A9P8WDY8_9HYPO|nr:cAMP phosphodiesterases class-II-domain-containing protein [Thelonectria olida]
MIEEAVEPVMQVIVLGSGGGPVESNVTSLLVRSVAKGWSKGSIIAVDAGVHQAAIADCIVDAWSTRTLATQDSPSILTKGPFAGLDLPYDKPSTNAAHVTRDLVDTYLITHPHLDHISGFVINTAGFAGTRLKKVAALPSTIKGLRTHIFNNVIWPNLSDENGGAGLFTFLRLTEGGNPALGDGDGRGYSEICDGQLVKVLCVSHGHCIERHCHRGSVSSVSTRFGSQDGSSQTPRRDMPGFTSQPMRTASLLSHTSFNRVSFSHSFSPASPQAEQEKMCVNDSSAFFIQDKATRRELLIFGDVEADSISLSPRNFPVWAEAAPKIISGNLKAIFIECSYDDSQSDEFLFGHLKPVYLIEELTNLAQAVENARAMPVSENKKRKRIGSHTEDLPRRVPSNPGLESPVSPKTRKASIPDDAFLAGPDTPHLSTPTAELTLGDPNVTSYPSAASRKPLEGLKVVIIHVKDPMNDQDPPIGDIILQQLKEHEKAAQLGCEIIVSHQGQDIYI